MFGVVAPVIACREIDAEQHVVLAVELDGRGRRREQHDAGLFDGRLDVVHHCTARRADDQVDATGNEFLHGGGGALCGLAAVADDNLERAFVRALAFAVLVGSEDDAVARRLAEIGATSAQFGEEADTQRWRLGAAGEQQGDDAGVQPIAKTRKAHVLNPPAGCTGPANRRTRPPTSVGRSSSPARSHSRGRRAHRQSTATRRLRR